MKAISRFALLAVVAVAGLLFAAPQQAEAGPFRPRVVTHYHAASLPTYYYRETTVYHAQRVIAVPAPVYVVPRTTIYVPAPRTVIVRPFTIIIP